MYSSICRTPEMAHNPRQCACGAPVGPVSLDVEAVEKVPKQFLGRDAEKSDLIESATINDLMLGKGQVTPENTVLTRQKDFSNRLVKPKKKWREHDNY